MSASGTCPCLQSFRHPQTNNSTHETILSESLIERRYILKWNDVDSDTIIHLTLTAKKVLRSKVKYFEFYIVLQTVMHPYYAQAELADFECLLSALMISCNGLFTFSLKKGGFFVVAIVLSLKE